MLNHLKRLAAIPAILAAIAFMFLTPAAANAIAFDQVTSSDTATGAGITWTLPSLVDGLRFIVTVALPLVVAIVSRRESQHKALYLLGLSILTSFVAEGITALTTDGIWDIGAGIINAIFGFGAAVLAHYGIYKPEGVTAKLQQYGPQ